MASGLFVAGGYYEEKVTGITQYPHVAETLSALRERGLKFVFVTDVQNGNALKCLLTLPRLKSRDSHFIDQNLLRRSMPEQRI